jgi:hypothetical protein
MNELLNLQLFDIVTSRIVVLKLTGLEFELLFEHIAFINKVKRHHCINFFLEYALSCLSKVGPNFYFPNFKKKLISHFLKNN